MQPPYKGGTTAQHTGRFPERAACDRPTRVAPPRSTLAVFLSALHVTALQGWHHRAAHWPLSCANARHAQLPTLVPFTRKYPLSPARSARHAPRVSRAPSPANARHVLEAPARLAAQKPIPTQRRRRKAIPPGGLPALPGPSRTFPCPYCPAAPRCARHRRDAFPTAPACGAMTLLVRLPTLAGGRAGGAGPCKAAYPPHIPPPVPCAQFSIAPGMPHPSPCTPRQSWPPA